MLPSLKYTKISITNRDELKLQKFVHCFQLFIDTFLWHIIEGWHISALKMCEYCYFLVVLVKADEIVFKFSYVHNAVLSDNSFRDFVDCIYLNRLYRWDFIVSTIAFICVFSISDCLRITVQLLIFYNIRNFSVKWRIYRY